MTTVGLAALRKEVGVALGIGSELGPCGVSRCLTTIGMALHVGARPCAVLQTVRVSPAPRTAIERRSMRRNEQGTTVPTLTGRMDNFAGHPTFLLTAAAYELEARRAAQ